MQDIQLIEIIDSIHQQVASALPDLDAKLERTRLADYQTASPWMLQECLAQVVTGLDAQVPEQARKLQRWVARSEAIMAGGPPEPGTPSWKIQEHAADAADLAPPDEDQCKALRYLSLPALPGLGEPDGDDDPAPDNFSASATAESAGGAIPSRFARELAQCATPQQALALTRRRLPKMKGLTAYAFLSVIGYPVAPPRADCLRLCERLALFAPGENNDAAPPEQSTAQAQLYTAMLQRATRLTGVPLPHIGYVLSLYSGAIKVTGYRPVCTLKAPACGVCPVRAHCVYADAMALTEGGAAGDPDGAADRADRLRIKDWSVDERPRERLLAGERLSNSELLAIILRTGSGRLSAVDLGRHLMNQFGTLHDLEKASPQDIVARMKGKGIGAAKAAEICAALELGRRVAQPAADTRLGLRQVASSRDIFELCRARYKAATQEEFLLLILNTKNRVQKEVSVSVGTLNSSIVHPRDVFRHALREAAAAVIFVHNHPSGDPTPSEEDILLTARLVDVGKLLGIQVLDHVIIGSHEWYSFSDHGRMK